MDMHMFIHVTRHTFVCISSIVTIQNWHLRKAEASALNPPIDHAARLSAEKTVKVPRKDTFWPSKSNVTPCSCTTINCNIHDYMKLIFTFSTSFMDSTIGFNTSSIPYFFIISYLATQRRWIFLRDERRMGSRLPNV